MIIEILKDYKDYFKIIFHYYNWWTNYFNLW